MNKAKKRIIASYVRQRTLVSKSIPVSCGFSLLGKPSGPSSAVCSERGCWGWQKRGGQRKLCAWSAIHSPRRTWRMAAVSLAQRLLFHAGAEA